MKPQPGQLSLFEVEACAWPSGTSIEAEEQASEAEERGVARATPKECGAEREASRSAERGSERGRRLAPSESRSLLSPEDVARRFGLSRKAVYRAVARGELRAARIRSRLRIDPGDLEVWFRANLVEPVGQPAAPAPARLPASQGLRRLLPGT
jgi:excisionase family DNA binding protein